MPPSFKGCPAAISLLGRTATANKSTHHKQKKKKQTHTHTKKKTGGCLGLALLPLGAALAAAWRELLPPSCAGGRPPGASAAYSRGWVGTQPLRLKPFLIGAISAHYPPCHGRSWSSRQPPSGLPNVPGANPRIRFPAPRPRRVAGLRTPLPSKLFGPHEGPARASRLCPVPTALASGPGRPSVPYL